MTRVVPGAVACTLTSRSLEKNHVPGALVAGGHRAGRIMGNIGGTPATSMVPVSSKPCRS